MKTLTFKANQRVLAEIEKYVTDFVRQTGEDVWIQTNEQPPKYNSFEELKAEYAQRIADIESGKEPIYDLKDGKLDEMMEKIRRKYENNLQQKIS